MQIQMLREPIFLTSAVVPTGSGSGLIGDYELIFCAISPFEPGVMFSDPTPGTWEALDTDASVDGRIALGIWGRFTDNPASEDISCNWNIRSEPFTAGSFRYSDVDPANPIIAVACNSGNSEVSVAPSVNTLPGSQVVRIFAFFSRVQLPPVLGHMSSNDEVSGSSSSVVSGGAGLLELEATTQISFVDGPTGTEVSTGNITGNWRACTIAIRMAPPTDVPTMSEWGLISFAAFAGIAGFWFMRRRQVTA